MPSAVRRPCSVNSAIGGGFQRHVRPCERREPGTRLQGPLAADRIRRGELGPQCGIGHLAGQVFAGHIRQALRHLGVGAEVGGFVGLERRIADLEGLAGIAFEELLLLGRERLVVARADPDRACAGTPSGARPPPRSRVRTGWRWHRCRSTRPVRLQSISSGPMSTSETCRPRNRSRSGDLGDVGHVEHSDGADDGVELVCRAVVGQQRPAPRVVGPAHLGDAGVADADGSPGRGRPPPARDRPGSPAAGRTSCSTAG